MKAICPIGAMPLQDAAKKLAERGVATGGHKIFRQLREIGMLNGIHPSRHAIAMGWLDEESGSWERGGMTGQYCRVFMTLSGLDEAEHELKAAGRPAEPRPEVHEVELGIEGDVEFGF
ncbi:MAG: hypothetical protein PHH77_05250 [Victivallaceae bacterium]|nr:hypothetical protein [Victivallaceae bacterium]